MAEGKVSNVLRGWGFRSLVFDIFGEGAII